MAMNASQMEAARRRLLELETPEMKSLRLEWEGRHAEMQKESDRRLERMKAQAEFDARRRRGEVSKEELQAYRADLISGIMVKLEQQGRDIKALRDEHERLTGVNRKYFTYNSFGTD